MIARAELPFPSIDPVAFSIGPFQARWYALAYIVGILLGWLYARAVIRRQELWASPPPLTVNDYDDFVLWVTLGIILGGRIGYVLFYNPSYFAAHPLESLQLWHGGMSFHGGFLGCVLAVILFAAGQETTARLITSGMHVLATQPALADELRSEPAGIPNFVEECLRLEGPIKSTFRLALHDTRIGGVDVPAGTVVLGSIGAANRDPRVFDDPDRFDAKRRNARRNIAFGHGEHFCPGASLARAEACVSFERLLARLDDFQLAVDPRSLRYAETFIIRGLEELPLRFRRRA